MQNSAWIVVGVYIYISNSVYGNEITPSSGTGKTIPPLSRYIKFLLLVMLRQNNHCLEPEKMVFAFDHSLQFSLSIY